VRFLLTFVAGSNDILLFTSLAFMSMSLNALRKDCTISSDT
jgi:hypothetical protein